MGRVLLPFTSTLLFVAASLWSSPAGAQGLSQRLNDIEDRSVGVSARVDRLERQVAPGLGFLSEESALTRFQECVFQFLIGEYEPATEGFFVLVTTSALSDVGLHRDAEWYLAEGLFQMGNLMSAEASFLVIAKDNGHPFREDAVRRLLELYAGSQQSEAFHALYDEEVLRGRVQPSALITYSIGKGFFTQRNFGKAKSYLFEVPADSDWYTRARYHLGAILVMEPTEDNLRSALEYFGEVLSLPVVGLEDRQVRDLSVLAMGRIHYELGEFIEAAEYYNQIGGDSQYLADALYEIVWTFIKQEDYRSALEAVEIFLIGFPEHKFAAQLRLLEGRLHYRQLEYDSALTSFEQLIGDYEPIRVRFAELAKSNDEPRDYFGRVLRLGQTNVDTGDDGLPEFALSMMMADKELGRAIDLYRELDLQQRTISTSELLIVELEPIIGAGTGLGGAHRMRYELLLQLGEVIESQLAVFALEDEWLAKDPGKFEGDLIAVRSVRLSIQQQALDVLSRIQDVKIELDAWNREAQDLQAELQQLTIDEEVARNQLESLTSVLATPDESALAVERQLRNLADNMSARRAEIMARVEELNDDGVVKRIRLELRQGAVFLSENVAGEIDKLHARYDRIRDGVVPSSDLGERFDNVMARLQDCRDRLQGLRGDLDGVESVEIERLRDRFQQEVSSVADQRGDLGHTRANADEVSIELTRAGFGRLEAFFDESLLSADMGIVDVYWAQKVEVADRKKAVTEERNELIGELDKRFTLLRQKLDQ